MDGLKLLTVGELKELLDNFPADSVVTVNKGGEVSSAFNVGRDEQDGKETVLIYAI